jgi:hypothetical protein
MSKLLNTMLKVADSGFESKAEVMMVSDYVKSDKKTLLDKEMVKNMNTASDTLNESFDRFDGYQLSKWKN